MCKGIFLEENEIDGDDYKNAVIELFKNGSPTDEMYEEMAEAVLDNSERFNVNIIDAYLGVEDE
jgi:hypothetical protein